MTTKLKTLKDINEVIDGKEALKQEAIMWVKSVMLFDNPSMKLTKKEREKVASWIMYFFNLDGKDLETADKG